MHEPPDFTCFTNSKLDKSDALNAERSHGCSDHWITIRHHITVTSLWARWRLKLPASWSFIQLLVQAQIKENIRALRHCVKGIHRWLVNSPQSPVNSLHKRQWRGKCLHLMTSSYKQTENIDVGDECSSMKCVWMKKINSHPIEFRREPSSPNPPLLNLGECPHRGGSSPPPSPKKLPRCSSHYCPVNFQKYWNKTSVVIQTSFSHHIFYLISQNLKVCQK